MRFGSILCCLWSSVALSAGECIVVDSENVRARDLAVEFPLFARLNPDLVVYRLPSPGLKAFLPARQLIGSLGPIGAGWVPPPSACVQWRMEELDVDAAVRAMKASIGSQEVSIRVVESIAEKVPVGVLDFPLSGRRLQGSVFHWRGSVKYGAGWDYPVWVKAEIKSLAPRIVATAAIRSGEKIGPQNVAVEERMTVPSDDYPAALDQVLGKIAKHSVSAGHEFRLRDLGAEPDVLRGELVDVEVRSGGLRLFFSAKAQASGVTGELISVRNPSSNRDFKAVVDGKGRVVLEVVK